MSKLKGVNSEKPVAYIHDGGRQRIKKSCQTDAQLVCGNGCNVNVSGLDGLVLCHVRRRSTSTS